MRVPISCGVKGMNWTLEKMDKIKDEEMNVRLALRVNRTSSTRTLRYSLPTKQQTSGCVHNFSILCAILIPLATVSRSK